MRTSVAILALLVSLAPFSLAANAAVQEADLNRIARNFFCTCGCGLLVSECESNMACSVAKDMKARIGVMMEQGLNEEQIIKEMQRIYGVEVLANPPKEGFSLVALWMYPVFGLTAGSVVIYMISKRRREVKWYIDPDEVLELDEEDISKLVEDESGERKKGRETLSRYDRLFQEKLEKYKRKGEESGADDGGSERGTGT